MKLLDVLLGLHIFEFKIPLGLSQVTMASLGLYLYDSYKLL